MREFIDEATAWTGDALARAALWTAEYWYVAAALVVLVALITYRSGPRGWRR